MANSMIAPEIAGVTRRDASRMIFAGVAGSLTPAGALARVPAVTPLFDFAIAGGAYYELGRWLRSLAIGERLKLRAEPDNPHDVNAVVVERRDGAKLGYVPRCANEPLAWALQEGGEMEAVVVDWLDGDGSDDLAFTSFMAGEPRIRVSLIEGQLRVVTHEPVAG